MPRRQFAGSFTVLLTLLLALGRPLAAPTGADDTAGAAGADGPPDPATQVKILNRQAMEYFDDLNYAMAEKALLEALAIVERSNLGNGPAGLATNGNLAVLYSVGFNKPDKAVFHFKKALAVKPDLKLSKQRSAPETEANLARAKAEMGGAAAAPPAGSGVGQAAAPGDFQCPSGGEVQAGEEITLKCQTASGLQPAIVMLYYKLSAAPDFEVSRMTKEGVSDGNTTWVTKIPSPRTQGSSLLFYFEANDPSGATLARSGSEESPSVMSVIGGQAVAAVGPPPVDQGEEEEEGDEEEEEEYEIDDDNPLAALERERWREHQGSKGTWWFGMGVGSGLGYATGGKTEAFGNRYGVGFNAGVAPASLGHLVPEIGYFVGRKTALALTGRDQGIFGGPDGTATGAHTLMLRMLFFTEDEGKIRWYFAMAAGGGEVFRLQVTADVRDINGNPTGQTVKDTVRGGPFVAGIGGGMFYKLSRRWRWTVDVQALLGFGNISAVLDLTTGVRWLY